MEGFSFISCVRFSLQLMAAESAFLLVMSRRSRVSLRVLLSLTAYFILAYGAFSVVTHIPGNILSVRIGYYISVFVMTLGVMHACFDFSPGELLFAGVGGYALQHISYSLVILLEFFIEFDTTTLIGGFIHHIFAYLCVPFLFYWLVMRKKYVTEENRQRDPRMIWLALIILTVSIVISLVSRRQWVSGGNDFLYNVVCSTYAILCCILELFLLFYIPREQRLRMEYETMEHMIRTVDERQKSSKKSMEIISHRLHDIKYQVKVLMSLEGEGERQKFAKEINDTIAAYESIYNTGNVALDYILSERGPICHEYNIQFSCIADGELLNFMEPLDITTLFGNALDNAIESVIHVEDKEKRLIDLHVTRKGDLVHIYIDNYSKDNIVFEDGLPVTSKPDKEFHGFGVKSICHIVEKYHGIVVFRQNQNRFILDVLCPAN